MLLLNIELGLYLNYNLGFILYFSLFLFLTSWVGIAFSESFFESLFFLEILYLSLIILTGLISLLTLNILIELFLIILIFFTISDSILGLVLTFITFKGIKKINIKLFSNLR